MNILGHGRSTSFFLLGGNLDFWQFFKNKPTLCFIFPCFCSHKFTVRYFKLTSRNRGALNIKLICIQWVISMLLTVPPMFALLGRMHQVIALFRNFQRKKWMHFHGFLYLFVLIEKGTRKLPPSFLRYGFETKKCNF